MQLESEILERIVRFQSEVARAKLELDDLMDLVTQKTMEVTGADGAAIEIPSGDSLVYRSTSGIVRNQLGLHLHLHNSLSGLCIASNAPQVCSDSEQDPRVDREACRRAGLRSMVVLPLHFDSAPAGVLKVLSTRPSGVGEREREIVSRLADLVSEMLDRAKEMARLRDQNDTLQHLASHDSLTGIANRSAFHERLHVSLSVDRRNRNQTGLILYDLDGLKAVNDTYGHPAGDHLIKAFATRLQARIRASDTVARLGGDEFAVVLAGISDESFSYSLARQISQEVEGSIQYGGDRFDLKTSFGVAIAPGDGTDPDSLLTVADERMYRHKRSRGRGRL